MKENSILGDTGGIGSVTSSCNDIIEHTKGKCQVFKDKTLVLMSHVGYSGLCLYDLEEKVIFNSINKIPVFYNFYQLGANIIMNRSNNLLFEYLVILFISDNSNKDSNVIISS